MGPRLLLPALLALLSACAGPTVRVSYPAPRDAADESVAKALGQVYVIFSPREDEDDLGVFVERLDKALAGRGGSVLAYRTGGPGTDPFTASLAPSSLMRVFLQRGPVQRADFDKEVKSKDSEGKEVSKLVPHVRVSCRLDVALSLSVPGGAAPLASRELSLTHSSEHSKQEARNLSDAAWLRKHAEKLLAQGAFRAAGALPPARSVGRVRPLHVDKDDAVSKDAASRAQQGFWEAASELWARRMEEGRGGWRDLSNLALAAETRRAFGEAARLYKRARESAGSDAEAAKVPWEQIQADLELGGRLVSRSEAAAAWFAQPVAVLPFSDETTSVDGPANLRKMTAQALAKGGYAVLPDDEVDRALRRHGYSQGGQLSRGKPADFAEWTGAKRLVFANVTEFRNVMLGFLGRREVAGDIRFWDAAEGRDLHAASNSSATRSATLDGGEAAGRLLGQLGTSLLENWIGKPLGPESTLWVVRSLRGLPLRPGPGR
ncbi:MAG: DUF799 family lipoprotein [Elusimicrobia bacterium]|nr:DUF799 family lipoprotein [Elusimicrobiota bacterium]